ncbi:MAG: hypothetical protein ACPG61_14775 [Paracoccaceae bacterium]
MSKPKNTFEVMARDAAKRLDELRDAKEQLTFLPDEDGSAVDLVEGKSPGRPKGAKGKVSNQMRDWLASKGYAMPEDVLAQMAGLANGGDAMMAALERTELVLAWAFDGATRKTKGGGTKPDTPSGGQRLATFIQMYTIQLRAADALLPYGAPKATPDVVHQQVVQVNVPAAPAQGADRGDSARVIGGNSGGRMMPADLRHEIQKKQEVSGSDVEKSDDESRTE